MAISNLDIKTPRNQHPEAAVFNYEGHSMVFISCGARFSSSLRSWIWKSEIRVFEPIKFHEQDAISNHHVSTFDGTILANKEEENTQKYHVGAIGSSLFAVWGCAKQKVDFSFLR